ncbi:MAG: DUF6252 family protein [Cytophagaceae bacterium]|nr:DUF6252 family protein [Cytophagaceae bacterium]
MKILSFLALLGITLLSSGAGCGGGSEEVTPPAPVFLRMKINGKIWTAASKINGVAAKGIIGFGGNLGKENLSILINGSDTPGTYTIAQSANGSVAAFSADAGGTLNGAYFSTRAPGSSLTVKVTQANGLTVTGTFSGTLGLEAAFGSSTTGPTTVTITDGEFSTSE